MVRWWKRRDKVPFKTTNRNQTNQLMQEFKEIQQKLTNKKREQNKFDSSGKVSHKRMIFEQIPDNKIIEESAVMSYKESANGSYGVMR